MQIDPLIDEYDEYGDDGYDEYDELIDEAAPRRRGPRRPYIRGGGRGSGRGDRILNVLIASTSAIHDALNGLRSSDFATARSSVARALRLLGAVRGQGPWSSNVVRAVSWLANAQPGLTAGRQGLAIGNLLDAHRNVRLAMERRRVQLFRPPR